MYNDLVLIGPKSDPAKVAGGKDAVQAFQKIRKVKAPFVSRGDDSGTDWAAGGFGHLPIMAGRRRRGQGQNYPSSDVPGYELGSRA